LTGWGGWGGRERKREELKRERETAARREQAAGAQARQYTRLGSSDVLLKHGDAEYSPAIGTLNPKA
jgi:hypothetical protein